MFRSGCTRSSWCKGLVLSCCPSELQLHPDPRMPIKGIANPPRSLASFLPPSAPLFRIAPARTSSVCSPRKKERIFLVRCRLVVDPIDPLQIHDAVQLQNPTWAKSPLPLPLLSASHPLPSTTFPMSEFRAGLFIAAPIIRLSVLGRIFFVTRMTALLRAP